MLSASALWVAGSNTPSVSRPALRSKSRTAASVEAPYLSASVTPGRCFDLSNQFSVRTSSPQSPSASVRVPSSLSRHSVASSWLPPPPGRSPSSVTESPLPPKEPPLANAAPPDPASALATEATSKAAAISTPAMAIRAGSIRARLRMVGLSFAASRRELDSCMCSFVAYGVS
jgi:hypothetical protein